MNQVNKEALMPDEQAQAQVWDTKAYARNAQFVSELGQNVVELLCPHEGERILDLGCGDGTLASVLAQAGACVVGIDSSPEFVSSARARGVDAHVMDAGRLAFAAEFDAVFSNAALHWMRDADAVIAAVRRALKPGGRFVAEFGGHGNVAAIQTALIAVLKNRGINGAARSPWYFPTAEGYSIKLEARGFCRPICAVGWKPLPMRFS